VGEEAGDQQDDAEDDPRSHLLSSA
jgi:hypothetical protein